MRKWARPLYDGVNQAVLRDEFFARGDRGGLDPVLKSDHKFSYGE
jgi:hypothetical protein